MMSNFNINNVTLLGRVTSDVKYTETENAKLIKFSMVTNRSVKKDGEWVQQPTFHTIVFFGNLAKWLSENLSKGQQVFVTGRLDKRQWEYEGKTYYATEVIANNVIPGKESNKGGITKKDVAEALVDEPEKEPEVKAGSDGYITAKDIDETIALDDDDIELDIDDITNDVPF